MFASLGFAESIIAEPYWPFSHPSSHSPVLPCFSMLHQAKTTGGNTEKMSKRNGKWRASIRISGNEGIPPREEADHHSKPSSFISPPPRTKSLAVGSTGNKTTTTASLSSSDSSCGSDKSRMMRGSRARNDEDGDIDDDPETCQPPSRRARLTNDKAQATVARHCDDDDGESHGDGDEEVVDSDAVPLVIMTEQERLRDERRRQLFYEVLNAELVGSGMLDHYTTYHLSLVSKTSSAIVRQFTKTIGGDASVLCHLPNFPGVINLTVNFKDHYGKPSLFTDAKWRIPVSITKKTGGLDLSRIRELKVVVHDIKLYRLLTENSGDDDKGSGSGASKKGKAKGKKGKRLPSPWAGVADPFALMLPSISSRITTLHLNYRGHTTRPLGGIQQILTKAPLTQLLHLTIDQNYFSMDDMAKTVLSAITTDKLIRLQSLEICGWFVKGKIKIDAVKQLLIEIGTRHHLKDLHSVKIRGYLGSDKSGASPLCCLLNHKTNKLPTGLNLLPLTKFWVDQSVDGEHFKAMVRFITADDPSWNLPVFGATMMMYDSEDGVSMGSGVEFKFLKEVMGEHTKAFFS